MQTQKLDLAGILAIKRFTTYTLSLVFSQDDGTPFDFTGCDAQAQLRTAYDSAIAATFVVQFDSDRTTGRVSLVLPSNSTNLPSGKYVWDMILKLSDGTYGSPLEGDAIIKGTSTQWQQ